MRGNVMKFIKEYYDHWGELNSIVDLMGDSGKLISALSEYAVETEDVQRGQVMEALGRIYLSMNVLIEALGREKIMSVTMLLAKQRQEELLKNKEDKQEQPEWDALDKLKEFTEEDSE